MGAADDAGAAAGARRVTGAAAAAAARHDAGAEARALMSCQARAALVIFDSANCVFGVET